MGTLAAAAFATTAQAGSLSADFRLDYDTTSYNNNATDASAALTGNNKFRLQTARLDYKGQLNEDVTYRVRVRLDKDRGAVNKRDNVDPALDYAYVANKLSDSLTLTLGKFATEMGGFEGNTAGPELYLTSAAYAGTGLLGGSNSDSTYIRGIMLYYTGAQLAYSFADNTQQFHLQMANEEGAVGAGYATNGDDNSSSSGTYAQNKNLLGLVYRGAFIDKTLNVIASYHSEMFGAKDNKADFATIGVEYNMDLFTAQLDYIMNSFKESLPTITPKQTLSTAVLTLKYHMDKFTPIVKFAMTDEKLEAGTKSNGATSVLTSDAKNKYLEGGLALEYTPKKDDMFRYHVAYNYRKMDADSNLTKNGDRDLQEIIVGTRILADFLK